MGRIASIAGGFRQSMRFVSPRGLRQLSSTTAAKLTGLFLPNAHWNANQVRHTFIDYFLDKHHVFVPSSPVIPVDDPTVLFTTAGMNQFKPIFLGNNLPAESPFYAIKRAVNTQKCMRAGGKHNDLDDVGKDLYHHTFFEMLGSWSFGDYYKKDACKWAWELLTQVYRLPANQLYVTYFAGDKSLGIEADEECRDIWLQLGLLSDRVLPFGAKDNFWDMSDTGPCGPCTEIHFDRIGHRSVPGLVNANDPDVIELWNLVFMQYNRCSSAAGGQVINVLPERHVDTGCGFERLVSVMQNVSSSYDTDLFRPILHAIHQTSCVQSYQGKVGAADADSVDTAYRIVADHVRAVVVALSEGGQFAKKDQGNVLRRMMRRAFFYGYQNLKMPEGTMHKLVPVISETLINVFPAIDTRVSAIQAAIADEDELFSKVLRKGRKLMNKRLDELPAGTEIFPGEIAFELHANNGFPLELTEMILHEKNMRVDRPAFDLARKNASDLSAAASSYKFKLNAVEESQRSG